MMMCNTMSKKNLNVKFRMLVNDVTGGIMIFIFAIQNVMLRKILRKKMKGKLS